MVQVLNYSKETRIREIFDTRRGRLHTRSSICETLRSCTDNLVEHVSQYFQELCKRPLILNFINRRIYYFVYEIIVSKIIVRARERLECSLAAVTYIRRARCIIDTATPNVARHRRPPLCPPLLEIRQVCVHIYASKGWRYKPLSRIQPIFLIR